MPSKLTQQSVTQASQPVKSSLTNAEARQIALYSSLHRFARHNGLAGTLDVVKQLSYIQIDTINVIERAHHHTLYNRVTDYQPAYLDVLLAQDKTIWEFWAHAASYIPLEDYPYYTFRMERFPNNQWEKQLWEKHHALAKPILERIRTEGPLSARHFEDTREVNIAKGWGDWKPAKVMLELLMWRGDLIVTARDRFQRVYDLTERVIPERIVTHKPDEAARAKFMVLRTLLAHGIATEYDIKNHLFLADKKAVPLALQTLCSQGKIHPLKVTDNKETYYCLSESQLQTALESPIPERVYLLSPFDNAVILRKRLSQLFAFDYTIECYVPAAKRLYGYWTMPVLYRNEFVGRIDPKADRKTKTLLINSLFVQSSTWRDPAFQTSFAQEMNSFMLFNGCETVVLPKPVLV